MNLWVLLRVSDGDVISRAYACVREIYRRARSIHSGIGAYSEWKKGRAVCRPVCECVRVKERERERERTEEVEDSARAPSEVTNAKSKRREKWTPCESRWWSTSSCSRPAAPENRRNSCSRLRTGNSRSVVNHHSPSVFIYMPCYALLLRSFTLATPHRCQVFPANARTVESFGSRMGIEQGNAEF